MFVSVVAVGLAIAWLARGPDVAQVGRTAPGFEVELLDGGRFDLSSFRDDDGRPLLVNLWASWCPPCQTETPEISAFAEAHPEIAVLGVAVEDQKADAQAFAGRMSPSYPLGFESAGFRTAYPSFGLPATYFIDGEGKVAAFVNGEVTVESLEEMIGSG